MTPLALRCSALDPCATREPMYVVCQFKYCICEFVCIVSAREVVQNRVDAGSSGCHLISYLAGLWLGVEAVQEPVGYILCALAPLAVR